MIKDLLCWGFSFSFLQLHTLTWMTYTFRCRRYCLKLNINLRLLVLTEGGVFLLHVLGVNVHSIVFLKNPGSAVSN